MTTAHTTPNTSSATRSTPKSQVHKPAFVTTRWSVVLAAGHSDSTQARAALENLCRTYWQPLYAYVRVRGRSREEAQDLTQEFFARLLEKNWVATADPEKGRFRSFLLTAVKRFMADEWDKARAQKRGGGVEHLPLAFETAELHLSREPADPVTPEQLFERRWAVALLEEVMKRLKQEYEAEGNGKLFEQLQPCLVGDRTALPYADLARQLGMSESGVKSAVHRLRGSYRKLLRSQIAQTVASSTEVDDELRHLFAVLGRKA